MLGNILIVFHTSKAVSASTEADTGKLDPSENHVYSILQMENINKASSCLQQGTVVPLQSMLGRLPRKGKSILGTWQQSSMAAHTNLDTPLRFLTQWEKKNKSFKKKISHMLLF